jgi:hypothetical protein
VGLGRSPLDLTFQRQRELNGTFPNLAGTKQRTPAYPYGYSVTEQQDWISSRLASAGREVRHLFVLAHLPPMGESHQDCLLDGYTNANPAWQNVFFGGLDENDATAGGARRLWASLCARPVTSPRRTGAIGPGNRPSGQ